VRGADLVIVGSYVPEGVAVGQWALGTAQNGPVAFYDIDTPITLAKLARGDEEYLSRELIRRYDLYLSFTGGPTLARLERDWGARRARPLYCSVDPRFILPNLLAPSRFGAWGTWAPTATTASPRSTPCCWTPPDACPTKSSSWPGRTIPTRTLARQRGAHVAPAAQRAPRLLQPTTLDAQRDPP
jgi:hypothetical protein